MELLVEELTSYFQRITKAISRTDSPPLPPWRSILGAFVGSFVGILVLSYLDYRSYVDETDFVMIVGSFGAQAILIFATPNVPLAQPWNCIIGNCIGALVGVSSYKFFHWIVEDIEEWVWVASAIAVSLSIVIMMLTKSLHPPAGATALIAVQGSQRIHDLGYYYVLFPAVIASSLHVLIGIVMNNISKETSRSYPVIICPYTCEGLPPLDSKLPKNEPQKTFQQVNGDDKTQALCVENHEDHEHTDHHLSNGVELVPVDDVES